MTISDRLQDSNKNIVHNNPYGSCKICSEIHDGLRQHISRCSHQYQNFGSQKHSHNRQHYTSHKSKRYGCMDCFLQAVLYFCPIISGNNNSGSHGNSIDKSHHQKNQISGRTDCSQRITSKKIAYDQGICCIIQLLKQISEKQWNGKKNNLSGDTSLCHS